MPDGQTVPCTGSSWVHWQQLGFHVAARPVKARDLSSLVKNALPACTICRDRGCAPRCPKYQRGCEECLACNSDTYKHCQAKATPTPLNFEALVPACYLQDYFLPDAYRKPTNATMAKQGPASVRPTIPPLTAFLACRIERELSGTPAQHGQRGYRQVSRHSRIE